MPPPNTISEAQLAANRANAKFSTGATTPEGKARSAMNALKTGLTGRTVLLPHEDAAAFDHLLEIFIEVHKPSTDEEFNLVESVRDCSWRIARAQRLETAILLKAHLEFADKFQDRPASERPRLIEAEAYLKYERQLRNVQIQEARLRRTMDKNRADLKRLQIERQRREMAEMQARLRAAQHQPQSNLQNKPMSSPENGFDFSNQPNPSETIAAPDTLHRKQAA